MPPPLAGRRIVLTRAAAQAGPWLDALRAAGAEAVSLPTILMAPPADTAPLDAAVAAWGSFDGIIFTSANAVQFVCAHARSLPPPPGWLCAVGPATAAAVNACGWRVDLVPAASHAEGVIEELLAQPQRYPLSGRRILFPRAAQARTLIPEALRARGAIVSSVACYRTVLAEASRAPAQSLFPVPDAAVDAVILTSPSAARALAALLGPDHAVRLAAVVAAAIGPTTRRAITELGWPRAVQARQPSVAAIINALREYWHA